MCLGLSAMQFSDNIMIRPGSSTTDIHFPLLQIGGCTNFFTWRFSCILVLIPSVMMGAHHESDYDSGLVWAVMKIIACGGLYRF